jgi:type IV pilus assembly protein PilO
MALRNKFNELKAFDWNNLGDVDTIGVWPAPVKFIIAALAFSVSLGAGFWFDIKDLQATLQNRKVEEVRLNVEFEQKAFMAANLEEYKEQVLEMEIAFAELLRQLPGRTEVPDLVDDITARGLGSGLAFARIELDAESPQEFYVEQPIQVEVLGNYHDFATFVSGVASLPRIVTLHDFEINAGTDRSILKMVITAKTYRYRTDEE